MNAVIYARYSSEGQREESIDGQIRECMEYCKQNGMIVVKEYRHGSNELCPSSCKSVSIL